MICMEAQNLDIQKKTITIDVSDAKVSADPSHVLVTYSLGSCIGVCLYNRDAHTGGMLHYLLPDSKENIRGAG